MKKIILLLMCALWMGFIFYNSGNTGIVSEKISSEITYYVGDKSSKVTKLDMSNKKNFDKLNYIVRKNAHAFEYIVLAILVGSILITYGYKGKGAIIYILFICLFYAVTDEFHQAFVSGRTSLVSDVLIDFSGAILGMGLYYLFYFKIYQRYFVKVENKGIYYRQY